MLVHPHPRAFGTAFGPAIGFTPVTLPAVPRRIPWHARTGDVRKQSERGSNAADVMAATGQVDAEELMMDESKEAAPCKMFLAAAAACLAMPVALAQNVTVYGQAHVSMDRSDDGQTRNTYVASNSSRLGFRGSEDLGNGLKAVFQFETGVGMDGQGGNDGNGGPQSAGRLFTNGRDTYVGLSSGFGTIHLGRLPGANLWVYESNQFADQVGDAGNLTGAFFPGRLNNAAAYMTPELGGFFGRLTYSAAEDPDRNATWGVKAGYGSGALNVAANYFSFGNLKSESRTKVATLGGSYDFGPFLLSAHVQRDRDLLTAAPSGRSNRTVWNLGGGVKLGGGMAKAQYSAAGDLSGTPSSGAEMWALGYDHSLSKRTTVYAAYAKTSNDGAQETTMAKATMSGPPLSMAPPRIPPRSRSA
jgi:predicted porin